MFRHLILAGLVFAGCSPEPDPPPASDTGPDTNADASMPTPLECGWPADREWTCTPWEYDAPIRVHDGGLITMEDGRVLVVQAPTQEEPTPSTWIWDPTDTSTIELPPMNHPRHEPELVRVPDGDILAFGGLTTVEQVERFDGSTWNVVAETDLLERNVDAFWLDDSRVFLTDREGSYVEYDVDTDTFVAEGTTPATAGHTTPLPDGRRLVLANLEIAGRGGICPQTVERAWVGNQGDWEELDRPTLHSEKETVVLDDGRVLIAGGWDCDILSGVAATFDPDTDTFEVLAQPIPGEHVDPVKLPDGRILAGTRVWDPESGGLEEAPPVPRIRTRVGCDVVRAGHGSMVICAPP